MAKLRRFSAYRRKENRPYTRKSKYREQSYIRASPNCKVIRFDMGNLRGTFTHEVHLFVKDELQIRHNALEAARLTSNRHLEKGLGKQGFHLKVRAYPHHFLRENPLASGAGADRMSTGMKKAFGKIVGMAAQLDKGQIIFTAYVNEPQLKRAKEALLKAAKKLPCSCGLKVEQKLEKSPVVSEETVEDAPEESPAAEAAEEPAKAEEAQ